MSADVEISDIFAAQRHYALDWDDRLTFHLLSVWGPDGVRVNGAILPAGMEPRQLSAGDELRIGDISLQYESVTETGG